MRSDSQLQCHSTSIAGLIFTKSIKSIAFAANFEVDFGAAVAKADIFPSFCLLKAQCSHLLLNLRLAFEKLWMSYVRFTCWLRVGKEACSSFELAH